MLHVEGLSNAGCVRTNNEDNWLAAPELGLFIVADGMGGAQAGEHASQIATLAVKNAISETPLRNLESLLNSVHRANQAVMDESGRHRHLEGMGTTLVALLVGEAEDGGPLQGWVASVGDSRAYLDDGLQLTEVTSDQTWVNEVGRKLGLEESALRTHPMRHVLTMALGVSNPLRVNSYTVTLKPGSQVLLSSDGLHGVIPHDKLTSLLHAPQTLKDRCEALIGAARDAGGPDNITAVIVRYE
jgi:protein phosphatase